MQRRALLFDHLISAGEQVPVLDSHSSGRSQVRWLAPPAEMIDPCLIQGPCLLISCLRGPPLVSVIDPSVTSSFTPSPIQERQQGSGDRDEIRKAEHALLHLPRHRAQLLQENAAHEPAREAPHRPDEPQGEDEVPVEVMRYDGDDADEPLDKAGLYLHVRDSLDRGMLETEEGDQDDADAGAEEPGIGAGCGATRPGRSPS
jgi:hypothetical protein